MESYSTPGFPAFYDALVAQLPPEYEPGADGGLYWALLLPVLELRGCASVLDLCTGTGRVVEALLDRLAHHRAQQPQRSPPSPWRVHILGVDSSGEMLAAAAQRLPPTALPPGASCMWLQADITHLPAELCGAGGEPFDLIVLSAGSFHHLLTQQAQRGCLAGMRRLLAPHPSARAVLNLLPASHLRSPAGSVTEAGGFRRACLGEAEEMQPDGGRVWRQRFMLERLAPQETGAGRCREPQRGSGGSHVAGPEPVWRQEEGWALREVEPAELRQLAAECGWEVAEQRASFREGRRGLDGTERIFVLRAAQD